MRIFERLPGRAYAAQQQRRRFVGVVAGMATGSSEPAPEHAPVAVQRDDCASTTAEAKTHDA